jgi:hypothetical protein
MIRNLLNGRISDRKLIEKNSFEKENIDIKISKSKITKKRKVVDFNITRNNFNQRQREILK